MFKQNLDINLNYILVQRDRDRRNELVESKTKQNKKEKKTTTRKTCL